MNNREKQIEERLDRKTALNVLQDLSKQMYPSLDLFGHPTLVIDRPKFEEVRKKYLDELPKDGVVLSKEEFDVLKFNAEHYDPFWFCYFGGCEGARKECKDTCEMSIFVKERKETAEKYFNAVIEMLKEVKQFETIDIKDLIFLQEKNKEIAKQFGFEIKE